MTGTNQKLREALHKAKAALSLALSDVDWRKDSLTQPVIHKAYNCAHEALAQPTADHLPDAGKMVETAAPVGEREAFEKWASRAGYLTTFEPNAMCSKGLPVYKDPRTHAAWWAWQARAALSAGDAVDAQRLDFIEEHCRCDPKMDGQHVWWPTSFNTAQLLKGPTLREAIDIAALRAKGGKL